MYKLSTIFTKKDFDHSAIYKLTSPSGKIYIGQCQEVYKRFREYRRPRCNRYLLNAINKYGQYNFIVEFLETYVPLENLDAREQYYLDTLQPFDNNGYNICRIAGTTRGRKRPQSERDAISSYAKLRTGDKNPFYGKKHSEDIKLIISNSKKGKKQSQETINNRVEKNGKPVYQICLDTKEIIFKYKSVKEAERCTGIKACNISSVANRDKNILKNKNYYINQSAGGFLWKF